MRYVRSAMGLFTVKSDAEDVKKKEQIEEYEATRK